MCGIFSCRYMLEFIMITKRHSAILYFYYLYLTTINQERTDFLASAHCNPENHLSVSSSIFIWLRSHLTSVCIELHSCQHHLLGSAKNTNLSKPKRNIFCNAVTEIQSSAITEPQKALHRELMLITESLYLVFFTLSVISLRCVYQYPYRKKKKTEK